MEKELEKQEIRRLLTSIGDPEVKKGIQSALDCLEDPSRHPIVTAAITKASRGGFKEIALKLANLAYELYPENPIFLGLLCTNLSLSGKHQDILDIIAEFRSRIELDSLPERPRDKLYIIYAAALKNLGRHKEGVAILENLKSDNKEIVEELSEQYYKNNEPEKTIEILKERNSLTPNMAYWQAKALDSMGQTDDAIESLEPYHHIKKMATFLDELKQKTGSRLEFEAKPKPLPNSVFIVHGHDEPLKQSTARFLEKLGLKAVILHEQPDKGRTIIEKFEEHSSVMFAVILLTPDDVGGLASDPVKQFPRARQNVIFELGYFVGKLGRERVCALNQGVEQPSDLHGVLYIPVDEKGIWRFSLARELKAAGLNVDLNKAM
jgi:predicted nucleotide-binding protein